MLIRFVCCTSGAKGRFPTLCKQSFRQVVAFACACLSFSAHAHTSKQIADRITRVEEGLRYPVAVHGSKVATMSLSDRMQTWHVPGVSIALINNGKIEWSRAYGMADIARKQPATVKTKFLASSISKSVSAVAALRLAAQRNIDLDEDINQRLLSWKIPQNSFTQVHPVTLRTLLGHTAGFSGGGLPGYRPDQARPTLLQTLDGVSPSNTPALKIETAPGTKYVYSSAGFAVLEVYLADLSGQPFPALVQKLVFRPLGMTNSSFEQPSAMSTDHSFAGGYELDGSPLKGKWLVHPQAAAAGLWSTPTDLARFAIGLQRASAGADGALLEPKMMAQVLAPGMGGYGLGFEIGKRGNSIAFSHSGSNTGYKSLLFADARSGQGAVVMTNGDHGWPLILEIMRSIAFEYKWDEFHTVSRTGVPPQPKLFDSFAGRFSVSGSFLKFTHEGGRLLVEGPPIGPKQLELIPSGEYEYFLLEKDVIVRFHPNGNLPVTGLTFVDGRARDGKREVVSP